MGKLSGKRRPVVLAVVVLLLTPMLVAASGEQGRARSAGLLTSMRDARPTADIAAADRRRGRPGLNTPPTAVSQSVNTLQDTVLQIILTGHDANGDWLTFAIVDPPDHGRLSIMTRIDRATVRVRYTPASDYTGADSFWFTVNDGAVASSPARVDITVERVTHVEQDVSAETGGVIDIPNELRIEIQPGGLSEDTKFTITIGPPPDDLGPFDLLPMSNTWTIDTESLEFPGNPPYFTFATLKACYDESDLPNGATESDISFATTDGNVWFIQPTDVDASENCAYASVEHFSRWALVVEDPT